MLGGPPQKRHVVEGAAARIDIHQLRRRGAIPRGVRHITITVGDVQQAVELAITWRNSLVREVVLFSCPKCGARRWHLYVLGERIGCRGCFELGYSSNVHRGSAAAGRVRRLRERLGVDPWPSPIPAALPVPLSSRTSKHRLVRAIERAEEDMIAGLGRSLKRVTAAVAARRAGVRQHVKRTDPHDPTA
jgi:hypothetical protein